MVRDTKDVINIDAVTADDNRKENPVTTDFAASLKDETARPFSA